jgi:hypothetical protein
VNLLLVVDLERRGPLTPAINNKSDRYYHFFFFRKITKNARPIKERVEGMTGIDLERAVCVCVCLRV